MWHSWNFIILYYREVDIFNVYLYYQARNYNVESIRFIVMEPFVFSCDALENIFFLIVDNLLENRYEIIIFSCLGKLSFFISKNKYWFHLIKYLNIIIFQLKFIQFYMIEKIFCKSSLGIYVGIVFKQLFLLKSYIKLLFIAINN